MKNIIFSAVLLFINIFPLLSKDTDTIIVTVDELRKKGTIEIEVDSGQVIIFKAKNKEGLIQKRIILKFWKRQKEKTNYLLYTKDKFIFGKKTANENISVISPVTGKLVVKLRSYTWIASMAGMGVFIALVKMRLF